MKITYHFFALSIAMLSLLSCNERPKNTNETKENTDAQTEITDSKTVNTPFKEGKIDIQITTPGNPLGELLQKVDPTKGNTSGQLKALAAKLSPEEQAQMETQSKKAGIMNLALLMLPLRSVFYLKEEEATAKFDALNYHGENNVNDAKKAGTLYMKSQNSSKAITISYTGDSFEEMSQNRLKAADYNIQKTNETEEVAGYLCHKSIYTLKKPAPVSKAPGAIPAGTIYQLEVLTSAEMPKSVNFLHPLYIKEDAGIMKILVQYEKDSPLKFLYQFTKVENRAVTADEMKIQKTEKIYDFGKDKMNVGMQMMGIVFGM